MREIKFRAWDKIKKQMQFEILKKVVAQDGIEYSFSAFFFRNPFMPGVLSLANVRTPQRDSHQSSSHTLSAESPHSQVFHV
jgi:hypothetical protein